MLKTPEQKKHHTTKKKKLPTLPNASLVKVVGGDGNRKIGKTMWPDSWKER
jgi:hypothetical protein